MNINTMNTAGTVGANKAVIEASVPVPAPAKTEKNHAQDKISGLQKTDNKNADNKKDTEKSISSKMLEKIAEDLNDYMDDLQTDLGFSINKDTDHQVIVEIKNRKTDEVVKQIPSKELLEIKKKMEELTGLIFDHKV